MRKYNQILVKEFKNAIYHGREVGIFVEEPRLIVLGGFDNDDHTINTVEVYNRQASAWATLAPLPNPRHFAAAAALEKKVGPIML